MRFFLVAFVALFSGQAFCSPYSDYDLLLESQWPITNVKSEECQIHKASYWIEKAQKLISLEPIQKRVSLDANEVMVIRNLLISQAYNRLFTSSLKANPSQDSHMKFFWIASGSQASVTVGHALQEGLAEKYPEGSRQHMVFQKLESLHKPLPKVPSLLLKNVEEVKQKTAENNWRVYSDIFWQHLVYIHCGYDEIVNLNKQLIAEHSKDAEKIDHYQRFIDVWTDMEKGLYIEANMKLIWIEQHNILQKYMYDGLDAKAANNLFLFNRMARAELSGPGGRKILSFTNYSLRHATYPNLGYFPFRFRWMKYVVSEQALYLQELKAPEKVEDVLTPSLFESYLIAQSYLL
ncbi:DUF2515 family protein [Bdellovibrio sp. HCB-162]|uniref:DUF2515 family protein n=1 Tax=Bdellovibrio sp. HCB-162 TaxID=3394234 RepID=UPI0039BD11DF